MKITGHGTFIYCKGALIVDGWSVDCEGAEVPTQPEVNALILEYIRSVVVLGPDLRAAVDAQMAIERAKGARDA